MVKVTNCMSPTLMLRFHINAERLDCYKDSSYNNKHRWQHVGGASSSSAPPLFSLIVSERKRVHLLFVNIQDHLFMISFLFHMSLYHFTVHAESHILFSGLIESLSYKNLSFIALLSFSFFRNTVFLLFGFFFKKSPL